MFLVSLLIMVSAALFAFVAVGLYQTYGVEHRIEQQKFLKGNLPKPKPDGFYKGNEQTGIGKNWRGKTFNQQAQTGVNTFTDGERYTFKTYESTGLRDHDTKVLRIDYNQPGNPWWLKFIVDEIVEVKPNNYLGKVHLKVIPNLPFTLMYFELSR